MVVDTHPIVNLDGSLGVVFLAVCLSSIIYGTTCLHGLLYYRSERAKRDGRVLRLTVLVMLLVDTLHQSAVIHFAYDCLITRFGEPASIVTRLPRSMPLSLLFLVFSSFIFNTFMTIRLWRMTGKKVLVAISAFLTAASMLTGTAYAFDGLLIHNSGTVNGLLIAQPNGIASLVCSVVTELFIATSLSYQMHKMRTGLRQTDSLITTIITMTLTTGMVTTPFNVADLVTFMKAPHALYVVVFPIIVAKLYANAFLTTLNVRKHLRKIAFQTPDIESIACSQAIQSHEPVTTPRLTGPPRVHFAPRRAPLNLGAEAFTSFALSMSGVVLQENERLNTSCTDSPGREPRAPPSA